MSTPLSLGQQADLLDLLIARTTTLSGASATETTLYVTADDAEALGEIAARLRRMSPHENAIKRIVTGR